MSEHNGHDLDRTRAQLAHIPPLSAKLPRTLIGVGSGQSDANSNVRTPPTSKPPINVALLDLIDGRDIEWWTMLAIDEMVEADIEPADPPTSRTPDIAENCQWLAANTNWIADHNPDFTSEIQALYWQYRRAAGEAPPKTFKCITCGGDAFIGDGLWLICREVDEHARTVKSIENEHRFKPAMTAEDITKNYPIDIDTLRDWKRRSRIRDAGKDGLKNMYFPWDVFLILNPAIKEVLEARDSVKGAA